MALKQRKTFFFVIIFLFGILQTSFAQKTTEFFINKKNQHSISAEFASISYTYIHQFAPKLQFGARIQTGIAVHLFPLPSDFLEPAMIDLINFQILYRTKAAKSFYFDMGIVTSYISFLGSVDDQLEMTIGLTGAAYYNYKKFHIGFSIQIRGYETQYYESYTPEGDPLNSSKRLIALPFFSPLIIGISI